MSFQITKEFPYSLGLSCVYRNHKATSHCNLLHGYALSFSVTLVAQDLSEEDWVYDFGGFKFVKDYLIERYDHSLLVAKDDPEMLFIQTIGTYELARVIEVAACSTEAFAADLFNYVRMTLASANIPRVGVESVTCSEHSGNSATYRRDY